MSIAIYEEHTSLPQSEIPLFWTPESGLLPRRSLCPQVRALRGRTATEETMGGVLNCLVHFRQKEKKAVSQIFLQKPLFFQTPLKLPGCEFTEDHFASRAFREGQLLEPRLPGAVTVKTKNRNRKRGRGSSLGKWDQPMTSGNGTSPPPTWPGTKVTRLHPFLSLSLPRRWATDSRHPTILNICLGRTPTPQKPTVLSMATMTGKGAKSVLEVKCSGDDGIQPTCLPGAGV